MAAQDLNNPKPDWEKRPFRVLDIEQLRLHITRTTESPVELFTDWEKDRPRIIKLIEAQGASESIAAKMVAEDSKSQISTYSPTKAFSSCGVVFPTTLDPNSTASQSSTYRALYENSEEGKKFTKFVAYHEGVRCNTLRLTEKLGIQNPQTQLGLSFTKGIQEAYADIVATLSYITDAIKEGPVSAEDAQVFLKKLIQLRYKNSPAHYELAAGLVGEILKAGQFETLSDSEIRDRAEKIIEMQASKFWNWLEQQQ